nr:transcriptional regulator [Salmonella enterica]
MLHKPTTLDCLEELKNLGSLITLIAKATTDATLSNDIESCAGLAWDITNSISRKLSSAMLLQNKNTSINDSPLAQHEACDLTTAAPANSCGMTIGDRIQLARENLGMSHDNLAEKLNIHPGDVLTWEDGDDQPLAGIIIPLANALKCDPMWLLTGESRHESSGCAEAPLAPVKAQGVDMHGIGKRIQKARVAKRMYTEELENAIGADEGEVFRWETEKAVPPALALYIDKLAKVLDVSVTWLLTGKEVEVSNG